MEVTRLQVESTHVLWPGKSEASIHGLHAFDWAAEGHRLI